MKFKSLFMAILAVTFAFAACDKPDEPKGDDQTETPGNGDENGGNNGENNGDNNGEDNGGNQEKPEVPKFEFPFYEEYPIEAGNILAEGSEVGVTIEVTKVENMNFVFELRPGPMVQSFKMDVYPLAGLYNTLLNTKNTGGLTAGDPVAVNELIRNMLFVDGSGGYAFSVNDFENAEDFLQIEYDWMNTQYAAASAVAIPDCGFLIAVVSSTDPSISSSNQEELTLCYLHTTSQPLIGDPQCEIQVETGYDAFIVKHHPNSDAAGIYYFGGLADEIDEYIDTFGDTMYRDFVRTLYSSPVTSDNVDGLSYVKEYGLEADHRIKSATTAVAIDANLTPQEGFSRQDFSLKEREEEPELAEPKVTLIPEKIAASYFEFWAEMPKDCGVICWRVYSPEQKAELENATAVTRKREISALLKEGYRANNPNFAWNPDAPAGEKATGGAGKVRDYFFGELIPGSTLYIGYIGRNGEMNPTDLLWSEPVILDERNMTSPDNCQVRNLAIDLKDATRTSFNHLVTYDPETVSMVYTQWIPRMVNISEDRAVEKWVDWREHFKIDENSPWAEWIDLIFNPQGEQGKYYNLHKIMNINMWQNDREGEDGIPGSDGWVFTGMTPGEEYLAFVCAEDFDGNISQIHFDKIVTKEIQVGPNPWVNMSLGMVEDELSVIFTIEKDVEYFKYCLSDNVADLNIPGTNSGHLNNIAESGIPYEKWADAMYEWVSTLGMDTGFETVSLPVKGNGVQFAACLAVGNDGEGKPVYKMNHLIIKDGKAQTLEQIFGKE